VIGVYIGWRGRDLTVPGLSLFGFWSRKSAGQIVASQNGCLAAISELALAARAPDKTIIIACSLAIRLADWYWGTISHSILDAGSNGVRNSSPWDMAVAFNSADSSIGSRQLMAELNYLYKYDESRQAYVARTSLESGVVIKENHPFLVILQSENDQATGTYFPIGTSAYNAMNLRFHWDKVSVPGRHGLKVSEQQFYTRTPGNNPYLVNYYVTPLGETTPPLDLRAQENRAFEANIRENIRDKMFYTSERNDGHEDRFCRNGSYNPDEIRPSTGKEVWRRWQFVYSGNARVPFWIVRVPKDIIWGHGRVVE